MTAEVLLYFWIIVSVKQKFWLITNLSIRQQKKHLSPKGVQFSWRLFAAHGKQTRSVNCTPGFQMEAQVFKEPELYFRSKYFLFSHHRNFSTWQWKNNIFQIVCLVYNNVRLLPVFAFFLAYFDKPHFWGGFSGCIMQPLLQQLTLYPEPNSS